MLGAIPPFPFFFKEDKQREIFHVKTLPVVNIIQRPFKERCSIRRKDAATVFPLCATWRHPAGAAVWLRSFSTWHWMQMIAELHKPVAFLPAVKAGTHWVESWLDPSARFELRFCRASNIKLPPVKCQPVHKWHTSRLQTRIWRWEIKYLGYANITFVQLSFVFHSLLNDVLLINSARIVTDKFGRLGGFQRRSGWFWSGENYLPPRIRVPDCPLGTKWIACRSVWIAGWKKISKNWLLNLLSF